MNFKISSRQLFSAYVIVPFGTAVFFYITPEIKQDAWIAMLIYAVPAILIQMILYYLWKKHPNDTLITYLPKILGNPIGKILGFIYFLFFGYEASRSTRDIIEIICTSLIPDFSMYILGVVFMTTITYCLYKGIENVARLTSIFFGLFVLFAVVEIVLLVLTEGAINFKNLLPIFELDISTIIKKGWILITFPYGESIVLTMLFPYVREKHYIKKVLITSTLLLSFLLTINLMLIISVLGVSFATTSLTPLGQTFRMIKIGELINRLDAVIIIYLLIGTITKVSYFVFGTVLSAKQLFNSKADIKYFVPPFAIAIMILSFIIARNYPEHIFIGQKISLKYVHLPLEIFIPIFLLIVYKLKEIFKFK